jgi:predicted nucleic acid-binding protein
MPLSLSRVIGIEQLAEALEGEGHMVQPGFLAGAEIAAVALARLARRQRARVEEGDAVVLVVIADERDEFVLVDDLGAQHLAVPFAQFARFVGLENNVRKLDR